MEEHDWQKAADKRRDAIFRKILLGEETKPPLIPLLVPEPLELLPEEEIKFPDELVLDENDNDMFNTLSDN